MQYSSAPLLGSSPTQNRTIWPPIHPQVYWKAWYPDGKPCFSISHHPYMQVLQRLKQRTTVTNNSFPLHELLTRMHLLYHPRQRIRHILHHKIQVSASRQCARSLRFLLEEVVMQPNNALMVDLLKYIQLSILVFFILKDVFHGEEILCDIITHLA